MDDNSLSICQLKITLKGTKPPIWRRILIPKAFSFEELHGAIQDSMGWKNCREHQFRIKGICIGVLCHANSNVVSGKLAKVSGYFDYVGSKAIYDYGLEDGWEHAIVFEKLVVRSDEKMYPCCISGRRACPPENCGGPKGFCQFLLKLNNPSHDENPEINKWMEGIHSSGFKAETFDPKSIKFKHFKMEELSQEF